MNDHSKESLAKAKSRIKPLRTVRTFANNRACSDTLFHVLCHAFEQPLQKEERASQVFAGGILQNGYQCGMLWGSTLAAGAEAYRLFGPGPEAEIRAILAAQKIVSAFRLDSKHINCLEITDIDKSSSKLKMFTYFIIKGGTIGCFRRAARFAPIAFDQIATSFSEEIDSIPDPPVSCATLLAKRLELSEQQTCMVAGLAGGIGLCGGACGALGVALWVLAQRVLGDQPKSNAWNSKDFQPKADALIDRFLKSAGHEFTCSAIVGKTFENVNEHSCYLREGGCSQLIEELTEIQ